MDNVGIIVLTAILHKESGAEVYVPGGEERVSKERFEEIMSHQANFNYKGGRLKFPVSKRPDGDDAIVIQTGVYEKRGDHSVTLCIQKL